MYRKTFRKFSSFFFTVNRRTFDDSEISSDNDNDGNIQLSKYPLRQTAKRIAAKTIPIRVVRQLGHRKCKKPRISNIQIISSSEDESADDLPIKLLKTQPKIISETEKSIEKGNSILVDFLLLHDR